MADAPRPPPPPPAPSAAAAAPDASASTAEAPAAADAADAPMAAASPPADAAEGTSAAEPPSEAAKAEDADKALEPEQALPPAPEAPKELEEDAPNDKRSRISERVGIPTSDTTLNLLPSVHGNVLMSLTDGPMQYFISGARANVGLKSGRYMFEVRIVEILNPTEPRGPQQRSWPPRQLLRIGFATASSGLFLGDTEHSVCFDSEGQFTHNKKSSTVSPKFAREQVLGVLLNLDVASPNAHTVSLFRDGERVSPPQKLPEGLHGKALFPAVNFRNLSIHVNFGVTQLAPTPFTCRMVQDAAKADVEMSSHQASKDGKHEVLFPVCLPDEGTFDWLDMFLEKHPHCTELSDRSIIAWAEASGIQRSRSHGHKQGYSNDRPDMSLGTPPLEEWTIRNMVRAIAPVAHRNLIVMEVRGNLLAQERSKLLKLFNLPHFKRVAMVIVGEPDRQFKERVHAAVLKDKQAASDIAFQRKLAEDRQKRVLAKRQRQLEREQRQKERAAKRAKVAEEDAAKKTEDGQNGTEDNKEEKEEEKKADMDDDDDEKEDDAMGAPEEEQPPKVELTDEERKQWFRKSELPDLTASVFGSSFADFSIPAKEEGFDDVRYEWNKKSKVAEYLKEWMSHKKLITRIEDLSPSADFNAHLHEFQQQLARWRQKQQEWKDTVAKRAQARAEKTARKAAEQKAPSEKNTHEDQANVPEKKDDKDETMEPKTVDGEEKADGEDKHDGQPKPDGVAKPAGEEAKPAEDAAKQEEAKADEDVEEDDDDEPPLDEIDVFAVADVCDVGKGRPLFANFTLEDWALLSLRFELCAMVHGFRKDVADAEREGVHMDNFEFYYSKYFRKSMDANAYGVGSLSQVIDFVRDSVGISSKKVLQSHLSDELDSFDIFVKLAEEDRRERSLQNDLNDEPVVLKFTQSCLQAGPTGGYPGGQWRGAYQPRPRAPLFGLPTPTPARYGSTIQPQQQWPSHKQNQQRSSYTYGGKSSNLPAGVKGGGYSGSFAGGGAGGAGGAGYSASGKGGSSAAGGKGFSAAPPPPPQYGNRCAGGAAAAGGGSRYYGKGGY